MLRVLAVLTALRKGFPVCSEYDVYGGALLLASTNYFHVWHIRLSGRSTNTCPRAYPVLLPHF